MSQTADPIIDCQVHAYEANSPKRPWHSVPNWPAQVTGAQMVDSMQRVGVDGAILVSPFSLYQYDASYAVQVRNAHPDRFALVKPVDPNDPAVADAIDQWHQLPGTVAIRLMLPDGVNRQATDPGIERVMRAAARCDLPVNLLCWGNLALGTAIIDRYPETRMVLDHLGILQPRDPPAPDGLWGDLPKVLDLARRDNLVIKVSGACTLSRESYPFNDIWSPLASVFDAWGLERCLWGTDWTRAAAIVNYDDAVRSFRLHEQFSDGERAMLMGGACARVYGWHPGARTGAAV